MASSRFSPELQNKIQSYLTRYETKRSSILPILHSVQDERDWISKEDIAELESKYELSAVEIEEVLTFYTMYRKSPPKPYRFEVCGSISCWLMGADKTIEAIEQKIHECEAAGKPVPFECHRVECLGVCGYAPVSLINKDRHLNVTPQLALQLIEKYSLQELPPAAVVCAHDVNERLARGETLPKPVHH
jgi:NADH-quinone oxidoreductase subunit E